MLKLSAPVNADVSWPIQGTTDGRTAALGYLSTDPIGVDVWPGRDAPALSPAPAVAAWIDATACTFTLALVSSVTIALAPGTYFVEVLARPSGLRVPLATIELELTPAPGSVAPPKVYGPNDDSDLTDYHEEVRTLIRSKDSSGFGRQRALARKELDQILLRRYHPRRNGLSLLGRPATGYGTNAGYQLGYPYLPDPTLKAALAADGLIVTDQLRKIVTLFALYRIYDGQVEGDADGAYSAKASKFYREWRAELSTYCAEVDINADGIADIYIDLSSYSINCG